MPRPPTHTHPPTHAPTNLMPPSPQVLPLCYAAKQYDTTGHVTNSMLVSVALLEIYVFKVCMGGGWVRWLGVCSSRAPARTHAPARLHRASLHDAPAPSAPRPPRPRPFQFFVWETGYWGSMDITHDRAGFYLCWGCLVREGGWGRGGGLATTSKPRPHPSCSLAFFLACFAGRCARASWKHCPASKPDPPAPPAPNTICVLA